MTTILENSNLQFILNPEKSSWSLLSARKDGPSLEDVWMRVNYRMGISSYLRTRKRKFQFVEKWYKPQISGIKETASVHGPLQMIELNMGPDVNGIHYRIEFAISKQHPLFLWRLSLENKGSRTIQVDSIEMLRAGFFPKPKILPNPGPLSFIVKTKPVGYGAVRPHPNPGELGFFSNGWQTLSYTATYGSSDVYRASQLGLFASPVYYSGGKTPKRTPGRFTSDMFGVVGDKTHRTGILAGFISQKEHFGTLDSFIADSLYPALRLWSDGDRAKLNPGAVMTTDWAVIQFVDLDEPEPLAPYLESVAREHKLPSPEISGSPSTGWCSWYQFFQDIDENIMQRNLQSTKNMQDTVPFDLFQIDDGFAAQIGDWFEFSPGFPKGVAPIARDIKDSGLKPGLWLSPFIVHSRSKLNRTHRDWMLRGSFGLPASAGFQWNNINKALDLTHPDALDYVCKVVRTAVQEWGYSYLKLDFLYAAGIKGRYKDQTKTRAQVLRMGLEAIRQAVGSDVTLLGCGVPLGSAIGIFDTVRIGADVAPDWEPNFILPQVVTRHEPNLPSIRNALQNTITRSLFHNRWWSNDPDCLLIRPDSNLTLAEVRSLATAISLTGGSLLISDDLSNLPHDRLGIVEQMLPLMGKRPLVKDWFDKPTPQLLRLDLSNQTGDWYLLAVFNWSNDEKDYSIPIQDFDLPPGVYLSREFWEGTLSQVSDDYLILKGIPAHGVKLLSLRPFDVTRPMYLGSSLHISQGLEVAAWSLSSQNKVQFQVERHGKAQGVIDLYLPQFPSKILCNQVEIDFHLIGNGSCRIQLDFNQIAVIDIH